MFAGVLKPAGVEMVGGVGKGAAIPDTAETDEGDDEMVRARGGA